MFKITLSNVPCVFSKFFNQSDRTAVLAAVPQVATNTVVFLDTAATPVLARTIQSLTEMGIEVRLRDHHGVSNPRNPRDKEISDAAARVQYLIGGYAVISDRGTHPGCSTLVEPGEFAGEGTVIVADPDADGLLAAMKAVGLVYEGLDQDAAVLDGPRAEQTPERLTPLAMVLVKGMATLPPFNPQFPDALERAKERLFAEFAAAAGGDAAALENLGRKVEAYEEGVRAAEELAATATEPVPGVLLVDAVGKPRYDLATLTSLLEGRRGCLVTVIRKDNGPIAAKAKHGGVQFSLAVVKAHQSQINVQGLLAPGFVSSPETGIICNTSFLLHVSEEVWEKQVLPALRSC